MLAKLNNDHCEALAYFGGYMNHKNRLPDALRRAGFSIDTHAFRYRPDSRKDEGGVIRNYSLEEIECQTIWHAAIGTLNDPFEVYAHSNKRELLEMSEDELFRLWSRAFAKHQIPHDNWRMASEQTLRQRYDANVFLAKAFMHSMSKQHDFFGDFVTELRESISIASFTEVCNSRLMWGYYCHGQGGFCLIYNKERLLKSRIELQKVNYSQKSPVVNVFDFTFNYRTARDNEILTGIPKFKHSDWEHESELRSLCVLRGEQIGKGTTIHLRENCIDGVIIGERVSIQTRLKLKELSKKYRFKIFSASVDLENFGINVSLG
ncbi:DUF2971 domain-containing protein [Serratia ureilytica]|uniref:DUF2971 domain-containing protein n=1 Tax=Serratia ureilytica TaxID=300181 RepID=UPI00313AB6BA